MKHLGNIITVIALCATAGAAIGLWLPGVGESSLPAGQEVPARPRSIQGAVASTFGAPEAPEAPLPTTVVLENWEENPGWRYARALQTGDWDYIVDHTLWMQERLDYVQLQNSADEAVAAAHGEFVVQISERPAAGNQLREEGVEDQYVFSPAATLTMLSVDAGLEDLEAPVAGRAWIEVQYAERMAALLDESGLPIKRLVVGVNYTEEGAVLKGGIVGNLEIDWESVRFEWDAEGSMNHAIGQVPAMQEVIQ
jgi:hypothetical protein